MSVVGAVSAAAMLMRATLRNHDKVVRCINESDRDLVVVTDFGAVGVMNHVAAISD